MGVLDLFRLDGKTAVVTGAGKGIGRGISLALAEAGANVVVASRSKDDLQSLAEEIEKLGRKALVCPTDVTDQTQLDALADAAKGSFGSIDIWVNNAGRHSRCDTAFPHAGPNRIIGDQQMDLNLKAVWSGCVTAAKAIGKGDGTIINISSRASYGPQFMNGPYGASKAAVNSLTATFSRELAPNVRINAVAPGPIPTQNFVECMGTDTKEKEDALKEQIGIPLKRYGTEEDIGGRCRLPGLSPASSWITGQVLLCDGAVFRTRFGLLCIRRSWLLILCTRNIRRCRYHPSFSSWASAFSSSPILR